MERGQFTTRDGKIVSFKPKNKLSKPVTVQFFQYEPSWIEKLFLFVENIYFKIRSKLP